MSPLYLAALFLLAVVHVHANKAEEAASFCHHQGSCKDCLHAGPLCSWCNKKSYFDFRCDLHVVHREKCKGEFDDQKAEEKWITEDKNLTEPHTRVTDGPQIVQLKPQRLTLKLRPGVSHTVQIQYRQAEDYPVDLYYLMDLSNSMSDDKEKLAKLGTELGIEMNKITRNFRLGFGSFVDKVVMPYVSMVPEKLREPCTKCVPPYGFRNHLPLTSDTKRFVDEVQAANVSGNLDAPEGGFDAIMQAVVCQTQIQWRKDARRILLFSTDAGFHYAGDGKLGGIVTPNDGQCHMDALNEYTHSALLDYPSLSQINSKIQENKVHIIFAVTEDQESIYSKLAKMLEGCSHGKLANDSSNVVDLVKDQYQLITSHIEMTYEIKRLGGFEPAKQKDEEFVKVGFQTKCLDKNAAKPTDTNKCAGLKVGDEIQFDAIIELKKCPADPKDWKRIINISPVGLTEKLTIDLEMICECACDRLPGIPNSPECNGVGTYQCGICHCMDGHSGKNCECEDSSNSQVGEETCRASSDSRLCSGRGECHCGECRCNERANPAEKISGRFCECDDFSCDRYNGQLCGGEDRGTCVCGQCKCKPGWHGADCSCATSNDRCQTPNGICNGHGNCHCGKCICDQDFTGDTCSECPTCPGKCTEFKDCVECQAFPDNPGRRYDTRELCQTCDSQFITIRSPQLDYNEDKGDKLCIFRDAQDCKITFVYREESGKYTVRAKDKECAEPVNILAIILGVILGIVLIGLFLLLIWKLLTTIHDRREYAKFEEERRRARFETGENPIYKGAISTFKNPTYGGGR